MDPIQFAGRIRYWNPERASGLAVVDIPAPFIAPLGGLKQVHVRGTIGSVAFQSNVMPAGGGGLALSVSQGMMKAAGCGMGDLVEVVIAAVGRD